MVDAPTEVPAVPPALEVQGLSCGFGGVQAVNGVSLQIPEGAFVGLIGPNGAGKSTLLDCISGLNRSYSGRVLFKGRDISRWAPNKIAGLSLGRSFQTTRLFSQLTAMSNLMAAPRGQTGERLVPAVIGSWRQEEARHVKRAWGTLGLFDLRKRANNYAAELSGGERRLVELSRILMFEPTALLLDEPFAGVSPSNRGYLASQLEALWREHGVTILMIEHRLEWIEQLTRHAYVMAQGRIIAQGTMAALRKDRAVVESYLGIPTDV